jgi:hypothetical protein
VLVVITSTSRSHFYRSLALCLLSDKLSIGSVKSRVSTLKVGGAPSATQGDSNTYLFLPAVKYVRTIGPNFGPFFLPGRKMHAHWALSVPHFGPPLFPMMERKVIIPEALSIFTLQSSVSKFFYVLFCTVDYARIKQSVK